MRKLSCLLIIFVSTILCFSIISCSNKSSIDTNRNYLVAPPPPPKIELIDTTEIDALIKKLEAEAKED